MTDEQVRAIVAARLREQRRVEDEEQDRIVLRAISMILTSFGINGDNRKEFRADLLHLRRWRRSVEQPERYAVRAVITVIVTGMLGAFGLPSRSR